jgi:dienelactone hydrolase
VRFDVFRQTAFACVLAAALPATALAGPLDPEAFARAPAVSGVSMSAEGDMLIGLIADPKDPEKPALAMWDISNIDGTKPLQVTRVTPGNNRMGFVQAGALKAGKVVAILNQPWTGSLAGCGEGRTTGATKTWVYKVQFTDANIAKFDDPFAAGRQVGVGEATQRCLELGSRPSIIDLPLDPENVIVGQVDPSSFATTYRKVSLVTGKSELLFRDVGQLRIGLIDQRSGKVLTRGRINPVGEMRYEQETYILNPTTGEFDLEAPLTVEFEKRYTMDIAGFDEETGKYFVVTDKFSDKAAVYLYDARTDQFDAEPVFAHKEFDAAGVILGRHKGDFGKLLGISYLAADPEVFWVDPEIRAIHEGLKPNFKGQSVTLVDWTEDKSKILFATDSAQHPTAYYILYNKTKLLGVGGERPWIKPADMGARSLVYYDARDGMKIPGLLTLPPNWKKGDAPPPAIVLPHGGPWSRDFAGWDASGWTQFLATRGYAVLQPQYRGSTGWGRDLWLAGDAEWGQKMQDDKDDGANWMVKEGYAAAGRIGIFGYSYGGYAAFAASVRPDGPFKCAIAGAGVSNLEKIGNTWSESRQQRVYQGRTVKGLDPIKKADAVQMPILIYHGDRDVRVPLFHAQDFHNVAKASGKSKLVVLKDMGHQLDKWTPDNHRDSLKAIETFLVNDCRL